MGKLKQFRCAGLLVLFLMFFSTFVFAGNDDVMITRDGSFINVKVIRINGSDVRFINLDKKRQGELSVPTDFVYMIMKEKGNNIFFDEEGNQMTSPQVKIDKKDNVLFLNDGTYFPVFNVSINKDGISYKLKDSKKAPVNKKSKDEVFLMKNEDGTTTLFNNKYVDKLRKAKADAQQKAAAAPSLPANVRSSTVVPSPSSVQPKASPEASVTLEIADQQLSFKPAAGLSANDIVRSVYAKQPYTLYGKGTVAEYIAMKDGVPQRILGGFTYLRQIVADEKVENGLLSVFVRQEFLNKKHEPSKGIPASFKSYYFPTEIDTAGTFHLTHDIMRDFYVITSRKGYAMLLPSSMSQGERIKCATIVDEGKNLFGGKITMKAEYSDFYVDGSESVTTPAGVFQCIRLKGIVTEDNSMGETKYAYTWWMARGVGFVKYEYNYKNAKPGSPATIVILNKLERP